MAVECTCDECNREISQGYETYCSGCYEEKEIECSNPDCSFGHPLLEKGLGYCSDCWDAKIVSPTSDIIKKLEETLNSIAVQVNQVNNHAETNRNNSTSILERFKETRTNFMGILAELEKQEAVRIEGNKEPTKGESDDA